MTKDQFIVNVIDEITEGLTIPTSPNRKRIETIITNAIDEFKERDDESTEVEYIIIQSQMFSTPLFKKRRQIQMPECVKAITDFKIMGGPRYSGREIDPDYRKTNFNYASAQGNPDRMLTGVVNDFYQDHLRAFELKSIAYKFSEYTHMLTVTGRDLREDVVAEAYVFIPDQSFYMMKRFFNYVCGKCMVSFGRITGFAEGKLIGGYNISINTIKQDGEKMVDKVEKDWEDQRKNVDFMIEGH